MNDQSWIREAVKTKAQLLDENGDFITATKFSMDPQITTFEMLQSLLAKAFEIDRDFLIYYTAEDHEGNAIKLSLLNDWDLDAALYMSSSWAHLNIIVQLKPIDSGLEDWDLVTHADIPVERLRTEQEGVHISMIDKLSRILGIKTVMTKDPMTLAELENFMDKSGRLSNEHGFRESVFNGGIHSKARKEIWRFLLNIYPSDLTESERKKFVSTKHKEYNSLKTKWKEIVDGREMTDDIRLITTMIRKDVIRTDRTHSFYKGKDGNKYTEILFDVLCTYSLNHPEVSYCQGMSDMASVLLIVQADEADTYLLFCSLMRRLKCNFLYDGKAMKCKFDHLKLLLTCYEPELWTYMIENEVSDLFFTYRWLLLELKREFPFDDALLMLEVMWSTIPPEAFANGVSLTEIPLDSNSSNSFTYSCKESGTPTTPSLYSKLKVLTRRRSSRLSSFNTRRSSSTMSDVDSGDTEEQLSIEGKQSTDEKVRTDLPCVSFDSLQLNSNPKSNGKLDDSFSNIKPNKERTDDSAFASNDKCNPPDNTESHTQLSLDNHELQFVLETSGDNHRKSSKLVSPLPPPSEFGFGNPFLMFAALTMILQHKDHIIKNKLDFDSIVLLFDHSVRQNDVSTILYGAKLLYINYNKENGQSDNSSHNICV